MSTDATWLMQEPTVARRALDADCWVDVVRGFIPDHRRVHDDLASGARWRNGRTFKYERWVDDVRRSATQSGAGRHPALIESETWLFRRYRVRFSGVVLSEYRHAREGLGFHRDRGMTWLDETLVALLTFGGQRPWLMRPDTGRPPIDADDGASGSIDLAPAGGDLLVMGGRCQRSWLHAVPTVPYAVESRISAQWRWTSRRGEPDTEPKPRGPRYFSKPAGGAPRLSHRR